MKSFALAVAGLAGLAHAQNLFETIVGSSTDLREETDAAPVSQSMSKNSFGCLVEESVFEDSYVEKVIKAPLMPFHLDYAQQEHFINKSTEFHKNLYANGPEPKYTCDNREPGGD